MSALMRANQRITGFFRKSSPRLPNARLSLVSSVGPGGTEQHGMIFVEHLPYGIVDVVRESFEEIAHIRGPEDDAVGYESLHDAVVDAKHVGARLLCHVEAKDLLFIFSQTREAFAQIPLAPPLEVEMRGETDQRLNRADSNAGRAKDQSQPEKRAVVFCKLRYAKDLEVLLRQKQHQPGGHADRCQVTWRELNCLNESSEDFSNHPASVGGATTTPMVSPAARWLTALLFAIVVSCSYMLDGPDEASTARLVAADKADALADARRAAERRE